MHAMIGASGRQLEAPVRSCSQDSFSVASKTVSAWLARQFQRGSQDSFSVASKTVSAWPARQFQRGQQDSFSVARKTVFSVASKTVSAWPAFGLFCLVIHKKAALQLGTLKNDFYIKLYRLSLPCNGKFSLFPNLISQVIAGFLTRTRRNADF